MRQEGKKKDAMGMKLTRHEWLLSAWLPTFFARSAKRMEHRMNANGAGRATTRRGWGTAVMLILAVCAAMAMAQAVATTTVQGTVYLANGQPGAGTLVVSWPTFATAAGQAVAADSLTTQIAADGFVSVNLAPNQGATPAGEYYTAVFYLSDGTVSTQYWMVPAAAQASLAQVQTQVMPAAQAVQAVSKSYVDESIAELEGSLLTASGGTLSGPLYLSGDPTQPMQAATKHYVDTQVATAVPLAGGNMTGELTTPAVNGVQAPAAASAQTNLQATMNAAGTNGAVEIPPTYSGTDTFTNANGVRVTDLRTGVAQQTERSVKEFGAVCDGATDDTNSLQAALNYANAHGVALTIPEGTCKTRTLNWRGESIGGLGKQVSALMGFPGQDVLASTADAMNILSYTRLHDLTIYVDQSVDASCAPAEGRAAQGNCQISRMMESNSIFSPGANGLTNTAGTGAGWWAGNCAIAMPAATGAGGNGLKVAEIENVEIATTGVDPMAAQYAGAHSTHTCGMYLAQWPQWSEFRNIDIRGLSTGVAIPALPVTAPAGLNADSNRWQNVTIQATHVFTAAAGSNNVLDNVVALAGNSSATSEPPTGLVLDLNGNAQGWTVRNAVVMPTWMAVQPALTVTAAGGAVTAVTVGSEHGLGWDPYGTQAAISFSGSCTAQATAAVNANGSIGSVTVTQGGAGCSATTTASVNGAGNWDTAAPVNLISGQNMAFFAGNLLKGTGGYTVWNAASSTSYGTQLDGGGGALPGGGTYAALVKGGSVGSALQVDQFPGADFGAKLQACLAAVGATYGGTCDARNFTGNLSMGSTLTIATPNTAILLPCATIATAHQIVVTAGTRNASLRGCAMRGASATSGSQGGTVFAYSGTSAAVQVGDPTYATDTSGFHMDNVAINTTGSSSAAVQGIAAYRTQEMDLEDLYLLGNSNQTGMTLDGTGNYTGGTFRNDQFDGFQTAVKAQGHQIANPATTDWMNASTFIRLHIDCPTSNGNPITGTYGINLVQGDGNTFTGGDVEGCATALHLGANAQNNTIVGLRNENSTAQVVADAGSSYNSWITGGTMFTGQLTDNGTRNSFLDTFHRSFNSLNGDWYGSQQDATLTNHYRLGIGAGNERGLLDEYQTDYGYRWTTGLSDATGGEQFYQILDQLNNVYRLSIGQYNQGQSSTNNQTLVNSAGTGAVVLNGSNGAGTGGVIIGSGGPSESTVATVNNAGNAQFNGTLQVGGTSQSTGTMTVRNNADAEVDYYLWPGLTASQKGSYTYKDWNGNSQWYMVKDASNNWALNSATGGLDSFKAYQSSNSGDTYVDTSNSTGHIRLNYESGSGAETDIYSGSSSNLDAAFLGPTSIKFPGLAATSGHNCLQVDTSGYLTNTGSACGGGGNGTVNAGNSGQIAYYTANGTTVGGTTTVPVTAGGTGAATAAAAVSNLLPGIASDGKQGLTVQGAVTENQSIPTVSPYVDIRAYGAVIDGATDIGPAICSALQSYNPYTQGQSPILFLPCGGSNMACYWKNQQATLSTCTLASVPINGWEMRLQGQLKLGTTANWTHSTFNSIIGEGGGFGGQYASASAYASIEGASCSGTLGTAITATNTPVTITPTFNSGCTIANLPVNSAITMRAMVSSAATATRAANGFVTLTTASAIRISPGTNLAVTGCSDSSFNVSNNEVSQVDFPNKKIIYATATDTAGSATGCTVTGMSDNLYESALVQCSNGTANSGFSCGANQITLVTAGTYAATDAWGIVNSESIADGPSGTGMDFENIGFSGSPGAEFYDLNSTYQVFNNVSFGASLNQLSIGLEADDIYHATFHSLNATGFTGTPWNVCTSACPVTSYPETVRFSSAPPSQNTIGTAAAAVSIDQNPVVFGGIKIDGNNLTAPVVTLLKVDHLKVELPTWGMFVFDNREPWQLGLYSCDYCYAEDADLQNWDAAAFVYTDAEDPGGTYEITGGYGDAAFVGLGNQYFNGTGTINEPPGGTLRATPYGGLNGAPHVDEGQAQWGEQRGAGTTLGPQILPFGSLTANNSVAYATTQCATYGRCTVVTANVLCPDGAQATSAMGCYELDQTANTTEGASMSLGSWTGPIYAGDSFLFGCYVKQGAARTAVDALGTGQGPIWIGTDGSWSLGLSGGSGYFTTNVANAGWYALTALATVATGNSSGGTATLYITAGNAPGITIGTAGNGNQFSNCKWAFIPGPNNPSYTGVTADQLEYTRENLYHGAVPSGAPAGVAATTEPIEVPSVTIPGAASGSVVRADGQGATSVPTTAAAINTLLQGLAGCNTPNYVYVPQSGTCVAQSGGSGGSTVYAAPPYIEISSVYYDHDLFAVTKPPASPTWLANTPTTVTTGTNGDLQWTSTGNCAACYLFKPATTSVDTEFRIGGSIDAGPWVWDSTNNRYFNVVLTGTDSGSMSIQYGTYSGSGSPSYSGAFSGFGFGFYGAGEFVHLRWRASSGTLYLEQTINGGESYFTLATICASGCTYTDSVGTIGGGGIWQYGSGTVDLIHLLTQ